MGLATAYKTQSAWPRYNPPTPHILQQPRIAFNIYSPIGFTFKKAECDNTNQDFFGYIYVLYSHFDVLIIK